MTLGDTTYRGALPLCSIVAVKSVTPADAADLPDGMCRAFFVGTTGDVAFIDAAGNQVAIPAIPAGWYWIAIRRVLQTGTTATGILALY